MIIAGLEKMSLVDYDGFVASTVFTAGCNFKCGFCHNAPLVIACDKLQTISESEVLSYLAKRKGVLDAVCISGGEPTLQKDLPAFIEKIKNLGYKVKLDTNGTNPQIIKTLFSAGLCDYFAMDVKNDKNSYSKITGIVDIDIKNIEKSVEFFLCGNADYEFRTTLISEYHKKENVLAIGQWIKGAKKYFLQKFKDGENCISSGLSPVDNQTALEFKDILCQFVPTTKLRGYDL